MSPSEKTISELSAAQFKAVANSMPNLAWMADADGWLVWYNQKWYDYTGTTPEQMAGWGWQSVHHPDVLPEMLRRWTEALKTGEPFEFTFPLRRGSDGSFRMFMTRAEPLKEDGKIVGWLGTNTDITEQEQTREQLQLVINELNHRVKNMLATVLSIAKNTFKTSDAQTYEAFEQRLLALSRVHDTLANSGWGETSLRVLIERTISTFELQRFSLDGPELFVASRAASGLAMTIHELCTNALKYGSLSIGQGKVAIKWFGETDTNREWLKIQWIESGGPPITPPSHSGFGLKLIKRAAVSERGGAVDLKFEPGGLQCMIRLPLNEGIVQ